MNNEYYGAPTTPTTDYLAHYGIKGMKWGVRRAIERGNDRALSRQYKKAQKKLAKLEKRSVGSKYAKRAALYGAGAAAAGGMAVGGTSGVASLMSKAAGKVTNTASKVIPGEYKIGKYTTAPRGGVPGSKLAKRAGELEAWSKQNNLGKAIGETADHAYSHAVTKTNGKLGARLAERGIYPQDVHAQTGKIKNLSNNDIVRAGSAVVGAGLGIAAARNAYKAATAKRSARKAEEFRKEMNKAFKGTKYATGNASSASNSSGQKKKTNRKRG